MAVALLTGQPWPAAASPQSYVGTGRDAGALAGVRRRYGAERQAVMVEIARTAVAANGPERVGVTTFTLLCMLFANAWGESGFDPGAWRREPDGRVSFGVFQCLTPGGAGEGHAPDKLVQTWYSTAVILQEAERASKAVPCPSDPMAAVAWFVRYVERPADWSVRAAERQAWLKRITDALGR